MMIGRGSKFLLRLKEKAMNMGKTSILIGAVLAVGFLLGMVTTHFFLEAPKDISGMVTFEQRDNDVYLYGIDLILNKDQSRELFEKFVKTIEKENDARDGYYIKLRLTGYGYKPYPIGQKNPEILDSVTLSNAERYRPIKLVGPYLVTFYTR